jgi:DNA invertase Pin-like site-specific DNA recombinase
VASITEVPKRPVRCAIYTRKSTEEGLDQEFSSLDAQRECAEAYILSQRAEGWTARSKRYDDGGFTGSNLERPALRELLADAEAGELDCVVVYKVDRLSRSLLDFARLMEVFDRRKVTFVSVTQQLNSYSPMGRLTLNVLLSFAQFEREIIGERTRDKQSAARRKGKWIGGYPMLGYDADVNTKRLLVNPVEAEQVRGIFTLFLACGSLVQTLDELRRRHWKLKSWTTRKGIRHEGKCFDRPALVRLLTNVLYIGEVPHHGKLYPGEQEAIVDKATWRKANALIEGRRGGSESRSGSHEPAILKGLLECGVCGSSMVPGYGNNHGGKYPFYACLSLQKRGARACPGQTVVASRIESVIIDRLYELAQEPPRSELRETLQVSRREWENLESVERHRILRTVFERIRYDHHRQYASLRLASATSEPETIEAFVSARLFAAPKERSSAAGRRPKLSRLMALALKFEALLQEGAAKDHTEVAYRGGVTRSRISQILNLRNLAPQIQEHLLLEPTPHITERTLQKLTRELDWRQQVAKFEELRCQIEPVNPTVATPAV